MKPLIPFKKALYFSLLILLTSCEVINHIPQSHSIPGIEKQGDVYVNTQFQFSGWSPSNLGYEFSVVFSPLPKLSLLHSKSYLYWNSSGFGGRGATTLFDVRTLGIGTYARIRKGLFFEGYLLTSKGQMDRSEFRVRENKYSTTDLNGFGVQLNMINKYKNFELGISGQLYAQVLNDVIVYNALDIENKDLFEAQNTSQYSIGALTMRYKDGNYSFQAQTGMSLRLKAQRTNYVPFFASAGFLFNISGIIGH